MMQYNTNSIYSGYLEPYSASSGTSNAIQCFSVGSSSHHLDQSRHFFDRGGPSSNFSSTLSLQTPLPHATFLAISENPGSICSEYSPEDIWTDSPAHGHSLSIVHPPSDNIYSAKSCAEDSSPVAQPTPSALPTLADMAIMYSSLTGPPSGRQPQSGEQSRTPPGPQDEEARSERRHPCPMCYKRFDRPSTLKKHMLVHTGEKAFQCETCGRRFGVHSNLNRHRARCILKPVNNRASSQEEQEEIRGRAAAVSTAAKPTGPKRRRRAPSRTIWIPDSLKNFNLMSEDSHKVTPVPLPPISPSQYEERDSWDENVGLTPYHPKEWFYRPRLPGPARPALGLGDKNMGNFDFAGQFRFNYALMTLAAPQKAAIEEVIDVLTTQKAPRSKRLLSEIFMELVDRDQWPEYYEVIPQPRCINNIRKSLERNRYKDPLSVYTDLALVFWNALYYNEENSQIAQDATILKQTLESEWKKRSVLPSAPMSPPPGSAQRAHGVPVDTTPELAGSSRQQSSQEADADPSDDEVPEPPAGEDIGGAEIVQQLEKTLQYWPGFGEEGWSTEIKPSQFLDIVHAIKNHKDSAGARYAVALEAIPEQFTKPNLTTSPVSFKLIESKARHSQYSTAKSFDMDMAKLFEKGRRWYDPLTEPYGRVLLLQRLYQTITSANPPEGPPYPPKTNFASLRAGPGNVRPHQNKDVDRGVEYPGVSGVTTDVFSQDKTVVDEIHYKGWDIKPGDWLHLMNPDDSTRPIIAQTLRCWSSSNQSKKKCFGVGVRWYYRPEQTFHPVDRRFWEGEIFRTNHLAEHPVEDVLEKVGCQSIGRHIRGRPRPPYWYLGWSLYVCESQYNDRDRVFSKITDRKTWIHEELRNSTDLMSIYPFERVVFPNRVSSPLLAGLGKKLPGGLLGSAVDVKQEAEPTPPLPKTSGTAVGKLAPKSSGITYTPVTAASALAVVPQISRPMSNVDRSVVAAVTSAAPGASYRVEKLPGEIAKCFDRDPDTNQVLWFPGPPVDFARPATPRYSMEYLHFLAKKRKREDESTTAEHRSEKKTRLPTVTETLKAMFQDVTL